MTHILEDYVPDDEIIIEAKIRFHPKLKASEKLFYAELKSMVKRMNGDKLYFSSRSMVGIFGVSHQTILNHIQKLSELKLIKVVKDKNKIYLKQYILIK